MKTTLRPPFKFIFDNQSTIKSFRDFTAGGFKYARSLNDTYPKSHPTFDSTKQIVGGALITLPFLGFAVHPVLQPVAEALKITAHQAPTLNAGLLSNYARVSVATLPVVLSTAAAIRTPLLGLFGKLFIEGIETRFAAATFAIRKGFKK
ncbi:MAG: hypothetical protein VKJ06_03235 [Vampirovibrionales bacterium]|nr:hypothetical protein [Vampirovibrionales bacterium]